MKLVLKENTTGRSLPRTAPLEFLAFQEEVGVGDEVRRVNDPILIPALP